MNIKFSCCFLIFYTCKEKFRTRIPTEIDVHYKKCENKKSLINQHKTPRKTSRVVHQNNNMNQTPTLSTNNLADHKIIRVNHCSGGKKKLPRNAVCSPRLGKRMPRRDGSLSLSRRARIFQYTRAAQHGAPHENDVRSTAYLSSDELFSTRALVIFYE